MVMSSLTSCNADRWVPPVSVCEEKKKKKGAGRAVLRGYAGCADGLGLGLAQQGWEVAACPIFLKKRNSSSFSKTKQTQLFK